MRSLVLAILAASWSPGFGIAQPSAATFDSHPAPPDLAVASAGFLRANQEFAQGAASWLQVDQAFLATLPVPSAAWDALRKLKVNKKIRIMTGDRERIKGRFVSATPDSITFRESNGNRRLLTIPRDDVRMVSIRHSKAAEIFALVALGALAGAAAAADAASDDRWSCGCHGQGTATGSELAAGAAVGALAFAIAGGMADASDEVIYFDEPW